MKRSKADLEESLSSKSTNSDKQNDDKSTTTTTPTSTSTFRKYLKALRPRSFGASLTPVLLGTALAYKSSNVFSLTVFVFTSLAIIFVHGAGNLVNTYYDYQKGVDSKKSDDRTLVDHVLEPSSVATFGAIMYALSLVALVAVVALSPAKVVHLALVFFVGLSGSFLYTGGGLKYIGMGDVIIVVSFGPVAVLFAYVAQVGQLDYIPLLYALPLAMNTEAILHANNTRDMERDYYAGVITIAIRLGPMGSYALFVALLFLPYLAFVVLGANFSLSFMLPLITLPIAFTLEKDLRRRTNIKMLPQNTAKLNVMFGLFYVLGCLTANPIPGFA